MIGRSLETVLSEKESWRNQEKKSDRDSGHFSPRWPTVSGQVNEPAHFTIIPRSLKKAGFEICHQRSQTNNSQINAANRGLPSVHIGRNGKGITNVRGAQPLC